MGIPHANAVRLGFRLGFTVGLGDELLGVGSSVGLADDEVAAAVTDPDVGGAPAWLLAAEHPASRTATTDPSGVSQYFSMTVDVAFVPAITSVSSSHGALLLDDNCKRFWVGLRSPATNKLK